MSLWGIITGLGKGAKAVDVGLDLVTSGAKGIDAMFYTDEEKAENKAKMLPVLMDHALKMNKATIGESSIRSITRRVIAFAVLAVFDLFVLLGLGYTLFGKHAVVGDIIRLAQACMLPEITLTVIFFYFGYYGIEKARK
jgi:hypothetical protein